MNEIVNGRGEGGFFFWYKAAKKTVFPSYGKLCKYFFYLIVIEYSADLQLIWAVREIADALIQLYEKRWWN